MRDNKQYKIELLKTYETSDELFDELKELIHTYSLDGNMFGLKVTDQYSFGTAHEIEIILELINDLRCYTQFNHCGDDTSITEFGLDYIREFYNADECI